MLTPLGNSPSIRIDATCFSLGTRIVYFSRAPWVDSVGAILICANARGLASSVIAAPSSTQLRHRKRVPITSSMFEGSAESVQPRGILHQNNLAQRGTAENAE